jgi:2-polyprenyl-6-methoxyphenol hydroxylase-like FAD-dependent oxidoreductase
MSAKHVVVVGGSVTGLGVALALSEQGHPVTVLESDATPLPPSPREAFERWERRGSPQAWHSHAFLARLHNLLRDRVPELYAKLLEHGATPMPFSALVKKHFTDPELLPEDDDVTLLACRRITFEWVLRRHVLDSGRVDFRDGVKVTGLLATPGEGDAPPVVTGVRAVDADGEREIAADFVVDASGRRSKLRHWLCDIGTAPMREDSEPCGIFYVSRFYRLRDGVDFPSVEPAVGADVGYMKYGIFPGDDRIFSVTLAASPDDPILRSVLRQPYFEVAAMAFPAVAEWVDPAVAEPITGVHPMGDLRNTRRYFVEDGRPLALGIFPVGDSLIHTNPINGRGCTLAWVQAFQLADTYAEHADDLAALAAALEAGVEREVVPWYEAGLAQDRDAIDVDRSQREGRDPFAVNREDGTVDPRAYMRSLLRDGLIPGLRENIHLLRAFMRIFNLLEAPSDMMKRPDLLQHVLAAWQRRDQREPLVLGPGRTEMIERLRQAGAGARAA